MYTERTSIPGREWALPAGQLQRLTLVKVGVIDLVRRNRNQAHAEISHGADLGLERESSALYKEEKHMSKPKGEREGRGNKE